jgi:hypothetical protein
LAGLFVEEPAEVPHGGEEVAIGEGGAVEVWALGFRKESAECGEGEAGLAGGEGAEGDAEAEPEIGVAVVSSAAEGAVSEAAEGVAGGVGFAGGLMVCHRFRKATDWGFELRVF